MPSTRPAATDIATTHEDKVPRRELVDVGCVTAQIRPLDEVLRRRAGMVGEAVRQSGADARNGLLDKAHLSVILFDEIEKAHPML